MGQRWPGSPSQEPRSKLRTMRPGFPSADRTTLGIVMATVAILALGAVVGWRLLHPSAYDRCVSLLRQVQPGMPIADAVRLMDEARPDWAAHSPTPGPMPMWGRTGAVGWEISCSRNGGCGQLYRGKMLELLDMYLCWMSGPNRMEFSFEAAGGAIGPVQRWSCQVEGDSTRCQPSLE